MWDVVRDGEGEIVTWRLVDANPIALRSWGRSLDEIVGRTTDEIFPGAHAVETFLPVVREIMETGTPREWEVDFPETGQILRMVSFPVGESFISTGFDVTELRTKEREVENTLQRLRQAVRAGNVGLWDWDLRTDRVHYSDEWKRQLGHAPHEIEDALSEWRDRVHPDDLADALESVRAAIEGAVPAHEIVLRMRHREGSYRWILAQSSFILDEDGRPVRMLGSHIDITDRKRLEDRVLHTQKLESLGTLAAGIAHDFNNLLTAIIGNLSLIQEMGPSDPLGVESLAEVERAAQRAQGLTNQLLTFAKGGAPVREVASIRELIEEAASFVTRGSRSRCVFSIPEDLANVEVDVGQLSQVITNLVINADQAMNAGGEIRIEASNARVERSDVEGLAPGPYVRLSISDDGCGIDAEALEHVFDPFYTTKSDGSGLGLATSYAIVSEHGGRIEVESEVGRGTTFTVHLPASDAEITETESAELVRGSGRLLIMDDDAAVRTFLRRTLDHAGYDCVEVADGEQAVVRFAEAVRSGARFDLVLLDLTIPGKAAGHEVLAHLKAVDPNIRAILNSGYSDDDVIANHEAYGFSGRLRKPIDARRLTAEVARVRTAP